MTSGVIILADGRPLSWHEFGDPDGSPVIYTAGTPVSGLGGACYDETARAAGLRWISPDKPGYGASGHQRRRSLASWSDDLRALAGHLGLDRFSLAGESGGALIKREWTFPLSEVATPVHLWHGARDRNAPIAFACRLARELPDATLHVSESSGHDVGVDCSGEVMSVLASCVK